VEHILSFNCWTTTEVVILFVLLLGSSNLYMFINRGSFNLLQLEDVKHPTDRAIPSQSMLFWIVRKW